VDVVLGDVTDPRSVRHLLDGVDAVAHLAALIGIPYSYVAPSSYVDVNVRGALHVLEAAQDLGIGRVVMTSTSEVYGTARYTPIDEEHPRQPQSPYSATKIAADALAESWARSFGTPVVVFRPFNTYGPRQSARAIIPTILGQLLAGRDELVLGSLEPRRDFTFVSDTAAGFVAALTTEGIDGETIHLGTGSAVSIGELAALCMQVTGRVIPIREDSNRVRPDASEVGLLLSDPTKAQRLIGWHPQTDLREGLQRTADYLFGTDLRTEYAR
jgi:nucleoside-diphosphate-sugar epimerase